MSSLSDDLLSLGITPEMVNDYSLPYYPDAVELVDSGQDIFGRPQKMTPETKRAWENMRDRAYAEGIELLLVSAYRSFEYQCEVIRKKLQGGRSIDDILLTNAIPGHSEHHTGRAIDLHSGENFPLEENFEFTPAFGWLIENAKSFNFFLSYPKNNTQGITYEPWHWCYQDIN